jgi:hypothetical protein
VSRLSCCLAVITLLAPGVAAGQTSTADGLEALMHGHYETAVRILRPLAEDVPAPDPIAQFFVAALYRHGVGVPVNMLRACGLSRAAAESLPVVQALTLADSVLQDPPQFVNECRAAPGDMWRTPDPVAFTLEPGQLVTFDGSRLTVEFEGRSSWARMDWGPDVWFLPVRHTAIDALNPAPGRRHFIEFFVWARLKDSAEPAWTLGWSVHEVVGASVRPHSWRPLKTVVAATPTLSPEQRALAEWVITPDGDVEQRVAESPSPERRE